MKERAPKIETQEQYEKRKLREYKERDRLIKEQQKPKYVGYFLYLIAVITIVYIVDEITTQISAQMQSIISQALFAPIFGEDVAASRMSIISTLAVISGVLAILYKPLSDRYGRKIFLVINTLGMGFGLLLVGVCTNIPIYAIGVLVINFFTPHDMQSIYIQETTPKEKRATYYTVIKAIATLGMLLIPALKKAFIPSSDLTDWRFVYLIPAIIAGVIALASIFLIRETDVFIESRLKYLQMSEEDREKAKKEKEETAANSGLFNGIKYILQHKQILWVGIADALLWLGLCITQNYEIIMGYGFAGITSSTDPAQIPDMLASVNNLLTQALFTFAVGSAIAQLIPGFIADKFGRKPSVCFCSIYTVITFILFWVGAKFQWNSYLVGFFCGSAIGAFWMVGDLVLLLISESTPTNVRVSVTTAFEILYYIGAALSVGLTMVLSNILGDYAIAPICLGITVVGLTAGSILLMIKAKDTKGYDLSTVDGKSMRGDIKEENDIDNTLSKEG